MMITVQRYAQIVILFVQHVLGWQKTVLPVLGIGVLGQMQLEPRIALVRMVLLMISKVLIVKFALFNVVLVLDKRLIALFVEEIEGVGVILFKHQIALVEIIIMMMGFR